MEGVFKRIDFWNIIMLFFFLRRNNNEWIPLYFKGIGTQRMYSFIFREK